MKQELYRKLRKYFMKSPEWLIRSIEILKEYKLTKKYYQDNTKKGFSTPNLIYIADNKTNPGGLSDRINGMLATYLIAKATNRQFFINHNTPFDLTAFLIPNEYNWVLDNNAMSYSSAESAPIYIRNNLKKSPEILNSYFRKSIGLKKSYHCYTNLIPYSNQEFSLIFNELFKPSDLLNQEITKNLERIGVEFVSITFRFQQLLGDFREGNYQTLNNNQQSILIDKCLSLINQVHKIYPNNKILVTSDSIKFLNLADNLNYTYVIPGKMVHMAYSKESNTEIHLKSFVDLFMLSKAQKIYLGIVDNMFNSGFPKLASKIGNRPFEIIQYEYYSNDSE